MNFNILDNQDMNDAQEKGMIDDLYGERLAKDLGITENPKGTSVPFQWIMSLSGSQEWERKSWRYQMKKEKR